MSLLFCWLGWVFVAAREFSAVVASGGYSVGSMHGLPIAVISLIMEHRCQCEGFSSCSMWLSSYGWQAPEHGLSSWFRSLVCSVGLPGPGIDPVSAVAGRFLSARATRKSSSVVSDAGLPFLIVNPFITYSLLQGSLPVSRVLEKLI